MTRFWRWVAAAIVVIVLVTIAGWPVYVRPQRDELRKADAIFVLGGPGVARYTVGLEDALAGYAPRLVLSNPIGDDNTWLVDLCSHQRYDFAITCFVPDPPTTKGEARVLQRMAEAEGWKSVIVVTYLPHISRARYIIEQCYDGELMMDDAEAALTPFDWAWVYLYQTAGYVRAALQDGC